MELVHLSRFSSEDAGSSKGRARQDTPHQDAEGGLRCVVMTSPCPAHSSWQAREAISRCNISYCLRPEAIQVSEVKGLWAQDTF